MESKAHLRYLRIAPRKVGQVAALVGRARSARAVGSAIARCPDDVPWHRVVNALGRISRRRSGSGMLTQRIRLEHEGVRLRRGRVPLIRYQWDPPGRRLSPPRSSTRWRCAAPASASASSSPNGRPQA